MFTTLKSNKWLPGLFGGVAVLLDTNETKIPIDAWKIFGKQHTFSDLDPGNNRSIYHLVGEQSNTK